MTARSVQSQRAEQLLAATLHRGIWSAAGLIAAGFTLSWAGLHAPLGRDPAHALPVVQAGLLLIILLPVVRVVLMALLFLRARDFRYGLAAVSVFVIISFGFVVGVLAPTAAHAPHL